MEKHTITVLNKRFEEYAYEQDSVEYWLARELQELLGYSDWRNFLNTINKAKDSCQITGQVVSNHFVDTTKMVKIGSGAKRASANPITSKGVTEHQSFYDISTTPTPVAPDRRFSSTPKNRSAKGKPPTGAVVSFGYTNAQGEFSTRLVRISRCGLDYLEGFDLNKSASRTFRLDRIDGAVVDTDSGEVFYL